MINYIRIGPGLSFVLHGGLVRLLYKHYLTSNFDFSRHSKSFD